MFVFAMLPISTCDGMRIAYLVVVVIVLALSFAIDKDVEAVVVAVVIPYATLVVWSCLARCRAATAIVKGQFIVLVCNDLHLFWDVPSTMALFANMIWRRFHCLSSLL